ncbi:CidA/LrgA family protein [Profundibacterium mesophilum]|uniref:Holin-like protein n=1 Tax=Profundibacterium mesophilum KAUST100406-0324 TaxID=1037889 RepID=A0A921NT34_9RHOB|nr:CidA/LrgA family protein [Profundibacterium mesophilum]KAF0676069.1 holin-like protein [Profundibacterium mesophilum KAUST100406-0324]
MIKAAAILLSCQLVGTAVSRAFGLAVPGPVLGLLALLALLALRPGLAGRIAAPSHALLANMSLLFVPAGVGAIDHFDSFGSDGPALLTALVLSTILAILAGVGAFLLVARMIGHRDE